MFSCKTWKMPTTEWESDEEIEEFLNSSEIYFCDVCEQDFYSHQFYDQHLSEHKVCGVDGCQYTAHEKMIEKHIQMQHLTGLYEKIRSVNTPEEIAKWREERKVKYPTKENVQKRYEKQEEMMKRGEKIVKRNNRFGKDNTRISRGKNKKPAIRKKKKIVKIEEEKKESLIDEKCDWNGDMFPFKGTKELFNDEKVEEKSDYEDEEWALETSETKVDLNNALGDLMGAYMSDDDKPTEEKIQREQVEYPNDEVTKTIKQGKKRKKNNIKKENKMLKLSDNKMIISNNKLEQGFSRIKFFRRRITLLEKLLDDEIRHERNVLLQCVQFVVSNNFFRND